MRFLIALMSCLAAAPLAAHPHIFVATGLRLVLDERGQMAGIEVAWQYDEFYSLLVLEDMELDGDYDGVLTAEELARLDGFDMHWIEGYAGDLYVEAGGVAVALGQPEARGTAFAEGRITTRHFRPIDGGRAAALAVRVYDPSYYTQYDLGLGIDLPEGCTATVARADINAAQQALLDELAKLPADAESNYPEVGAQFADRIEVTCAAGS
jgi:ABC-type uncharacterized transport system substrate-binding protein